MGPMPDRRPPVQDTDRPGRVPVAGALVAIATVAIGMSLGTRHLDLVLYYTSVGATLLLASVFGAAFDARTGLRLTLVLGIAVAAGPALVSPQLQVEPVVGVLWIAFGWLVTLAVVLGAWAVGGFVRAVHRAIVATRS